MVTAFSLQVFYYLLYVWAETKGGWPRGARTGRQQHLPLHYPTLRLTFATSPKWDFQNGTCMFLRGRRKNGWVMDISLGGGRDVREAVLYRNSQIYIFSFSEIDFPWLLVAPASLHYKQMTLFVREISPELRCCRQVGRNEVGKFYYNRFRNKRRRRMEAGCDADCFWSDLSPKDQMLRVNWIRSTL